MKGDATRKLTFCAAAIANAVLIFIIFLSSIPALAYPKHAILLNMTLYLVIVSAVFTLVIGLRIWFDTLQTRSNLALLWSRQPTATQDLLQHRFKCCGYTDFQTPPFIVDSVCTDVLVAANQGGCAGPFSDFANGFLDVVFTTAFGIVGIHLALLLAGAALSKQRKEIERYRRIDEKREFAPI